MKNDKETLYNITVIKRDTMEERMDKIKKSIHENAEQYYSIFISDDNEKTIIIERKGTAYHFHIWDFDGIFFIEFPPIEQIFEDGAKEMMDVNDLYIYERIVSCGLAFPILNSDYEKIRPKVIKRIKVEK